MQLDYLQIGIDVVSLLITIGMASEAALLILSMRRGMLERSWTLISYGSVSLALGIIMFGAGEVFPSYILFQVGNFFMVAGGILIFLGLRAQRKVWKPARAQAIERQA